MKISKCDRYIWRVLEFHSQPFRKLLKLLSCWKEFVGRRSEAVLSVAFSPDSRHLASRSGDNTVWLWDLNTQTRLFTCTGTFIHSSEAQNGILNQIEKKMARAIIGTHMVVGLFWPQLECMNLTLVGSVVHPDNELLLMSSLLYFLHEAVDWSSVQHSGGNGVG